MRYFMLILSLTLIFTRCGKASYTQGERLYNVYCSNCHLNDGKGLRGLIPPLADADYLLHHITQLPCIIKHGVKGEIVVNGVTYNENMVGFPNLTEAEIANIANFISSKWGKKDYYISERGVREVLQTCK